jgi:DNA-binding SARP family transcriptional activator/pimeloyl-ACP methyl ester carboxylesterase
MRAQLTDRVQIEVGDACVDEAALPGQQGRLALAYLLAEHDRPVARDELADLLWRGAPPSSWEKNLAVVISKLRAALAKAGLSEGILTHAFGCYQLNLPAGASLDIEEAEAAVELAEQALAQHDASRSRTAASVGAAIARRKFLPGAEGVWVEEKRTELAVLRRRALHCISDAALMLGDPATAAAAATEAVSLEPYHEQGYLKLIQAQAAAGNRAEALHTYERCRRLLADELGVSPSPQTEAAYLALLGVDTDASTPRAATAHRPVMVARPVIRFAKDGDVSIAYHVFGVDSPDLLAFSSAMLPIDSMDEEPSLASFHQRLASLRRLIRFDLRGVGMSDSVVPSDPPTLEQWAHDALSVMEHAGSLRASVFAPRDASLPAILLAATHPDRVTSLILVNGSARYARAEDYPAGLPQRILDEFLDHNFEPDALDRGYDSLGFFAPTVAHDETFRAWWNRAGNRGASPATAHLIDRVLLTADVRPFLEHVRAPTLVLHRRDDVAVPIGQGRYLAEHIPNATFVELPGADDLYWIGDTERMLDEIEEFLTGVPQRAHTDRVLATVVFAEIVGAPEQLSRLGERRWRDLLDSQLVAVRRELERCRGHEINMTGDRVAAAFDGPVRAVIFAQAVRDAATQLGLAARAGVHIGEVDLEGGSADETTVQLAARIAALAEPREVLVSRTVVDVIVGSDISTVDRGEHLLNSAPGSWRLYAVVD